MSDSQQYVKGVLRNSASDIVEIQHFLLNTNWKTGYTIRVNQGRI